MTDGPRVLPRLGVEIPGGYHELPLSDVRKTLEAAQNVIAGSVREDVRPVLPDVLGMLEFLLEQLAARQTVYCGIGAHLVDESTDEAALSWLTVTIAPGGEAQNPRLALRDVFEAKALDGPPTGVEIVDVAGTPVLFHERTETYSAPGVAGFVAAGGSVFQIEAVVPSPDGVNLAVIELSTTYLDHGERYRPMMVAIAASVSFVGSGDRAGTLNLP